MSFWECLRVLKTYHKSLKQVKKELKTKKSKKLKLKINQQRQQKQKTSNSNKKIKWEKA